MTNDVLKVFLRFVMCVVWIDKKNILKVMYVNIS